MTNIKIMSKRVFHIAQCVSLWFTWFLCSHDLVQMSLIVGVITCFVKPNTTLIGWICFKIQKDNNIFFIMLFTVGS